MINKLKKTSILIISAAIFIIIIIVCANSIGKEINNSVIKNRFTVILPNEDFCSLVIENNTLWGGGADGLYKIDMNTLKTQKIGNYKFVRALLNTKQGLWIGHDDGLTLIGNTTITYTKKDALPDNRVNALAQDKDGNIWVGTWGGAVKYDGNNFTVLKKKDGLLDDMVNVIMQDSIGAMWFGSYVAPRGGVSILYNDKWLYFTISNALLHSNVNAIIELNNKSVLVGGGLYTKGGGTYFKYLNNSIIKTSTLSKNDGIAGGKIRSLFEDSTGRLWVGSEYDGLAVITKNETVILNEKNGLSNDEVKKIAEDKSGNIWLGTRSGITKINKGGI